MRIVTARAPWFIAAAGLVALAVAVVVVVSDSASPEDTPRNSHVRGVVLFVGDSNVTLAATNIVWALTWQEHSDNGYVPVMAGRVGASIRTYDCLEPAGCASTDYWKTRLDELLSKVSPDVIVSNLGVNDTVTGGTASTPGAARYDEKIDWFMELVPRDTPVLWTNLPCAIEPESVAERCAVVNQALAAAPERWSNLELVDWSAVASGHPEYMDDAPGELHLSPQGLREWTAVVVKELDAMFPVAEP
jgi:hypothetical protein